MSDIYSHFPNKYNFVSINYTIFNATWIISVYLGTIAEYNAISYFLIPYYDLLLLNG